MLQLERVEGRGFAGEWNPEEYDHALAYANTFGSLPNETLYKKIDLDTLRAGAFHTELGHAYDARPYLNDVWAAKASSLIEMSAKANPAQYSQGTGVANQAINPTGALPGAVSGVAYQPWGPTPATPSFTDNTMREGGAGAAGMHGFRLGGPGAVDLTMAPIALDPKIPDISRIHTPLAELISRVTNLGPYAHWNRLVRKAAAFTADEGANLNPGKDRVERKMARIKFLYSIGQVTGQAIASQPAFTFEGFMPGPGAVSPYTDVGAPNAMQFRVTTAARAIREKEEDLIINGDEGAMSTDFDGIVKQLAGYNSIDKNTGATTTNATAKKITVLDINKAIEYAYAGRGVAVAADSGQNTIEVKETRGGGLPNIAICSPGVFTQLLDYIASKIGFMTPALQTAWGFSSIILNTSIGAIPVIMDRFLNNTPGKMSIYFLDMSVIEMRVMQDLTYERLAKLGDWNKFMLKLYETLVIKVPEFCSSIVEIGTATNGALEVT